MADTEGCKRKLEISIPAEEVEKETERVVADLRAKVRLPGFRPGKAPPSLIRSRYAGEIRQEVLEALVPRYLRAEFEKENLDVVGTPNVTNIHFAKGEPLTFTAEFEVTPEIELEDYRNIEIEYEVPEVSEEEVDERLERIREQKAEYVNIDPRPVKEGDIAVVALRSVGGIEGPPIENDELMLDVGAEETLEDFTRNLLGMEPGQEKEFDVRYPDDYGQERLAGKTVRFHVTLKAIRKKELPELNDEFAQDLGDYKNLEELRERVRRAMRDEREFIAQQQAKEKLIEKLVDMHEFPVPEAYVEGQIEAIVRDRLSELAVQGMDPRQAKIDWEKVKAAYRERAVREVKASLILNRIAEREAIEVTRDELDERIRQIAARRREPVAAVRKELEEAGEIPRIATRIRTEKTLNLLFESARKVAPEE